MPRTTRTQAELQTDSRTLLYELEMLCGTAAQLASLDRNLQRIAYNSTVESFAVHCRALVAFFFDPTTIHDTDVIAADFFANPDQWLLAHKIDDFFRTVRVQANKQIAHITTERRNLNAAGGKDGVWQVSDTVQAICKLMADFLATAPDQNMDRDAKRKLHEFVRQITQPPVSPAVVYGSQTNSPASPQGQARQQLTDVRTIGASMTGKTCP